MGLLSPQERMDRQGDPLQKKGRGLPHRAYAGHKIRFCFLLLSISVLGGFLSGCTVKQVVARSTTGIIQDAFAAFNEEEDLILAEGAAASNLKLLEGLLKADPHNREMLLLAARGFGGYAYAFTEEKDTDRAGRLYLRGRDYGLRLLRLDGFSPPAKLEGFQQAVRRLDRDAVPAIFWTAYNWANWINLSKDSPRALADLPRVLALMQRVLDLDEKYFYGGAHVFFGSYYGGTPKIAGGDVKAAKRHFDRAVEISEGKFLTNFIFYARFFAIPAQDRKAYIQLLQRVTGAPSGILPAERLANTIARKRAVRMLDEADEYF